MFSRLSLRKLQPSVHRAVAVQRLNARKLSSLPSGSDYEGGHFGGARGSSSEFCSFLKSASSGVVIFGSTLTFCYCSSDSPNANSFLSFADYQREPAWTTREPQFQQESRHEKKSKFLFKDEYRKRVFFKYEKRMRLQSPPEKVFEYFASVRTTSGEVFMTPADLMRAIVPVFPPSESDRVREGFLRGEPIPVELHCAPSEFFMLFDTNNDGLISFPEYIFFVTLLSIPESSFTVAFKMFDLDNNGEIDREEFKKVMALMRSQNRQGSCHRDGRRLRIKTSVENGGLLEHFFGKEGNTCLQHGKFVDFLRDLHGEILRLEFCHYDYNKRGTISAKDFALSLVASADIHHVNKLLKRVDDLDNEPNIKHSQITFEEFRAFADLRKKLESLSLAIFSYGKVNGVLTKNDFQRAASQVCGVSITDKVVDIIFYVFDANRDGSLSANEFVRVVQRRESYMSRNSNSGFFQGLISCWISCTTNCSAAKLHL